MGDLRRPRPCLGRGGGVALMSAYAAQGQRHLVARAYRRCCDGLEELGLKPSVVLEKAYQTTSQEVALSATPSAADAIEPTRNLPTFPSSFVGREAEEAEVGSLVRSWRLVTVTGAGGSGKTRLAVEVAAGWPRKAPGAASSSNWPPSRNRARCRRPWRAPPGARAARTTAPKGPRRGPRRAGPPRRHGQLRARHRRHRGTG